MPIYFDAEKQTFRLDAGTSSYVMRVGPHGYLLHLHYGAHTSDLDLSYMEPSLPRASFCPRPHGDPETPFSLDYYPMEYPAYGVGDFRTAAVSILGANGCASTDLRYRSHEIRSGKYALKGLPSVYANETDAVDTLDITLSDELTGAKVHLLYGVFADRKRGLYDGD